MVHPVILIVQPLNIGNALRLFLRPPAGAVRWRVLRKDTDDFSGNDDPAALVVYDGAEKAVTDIGGLYNGFPVFYRVYYSVAGQWVPSNSMQGTPLSNFSDGSVDPLLLVRDRLEHGLAIYTEAGKLAHNSGRIPVLTAAPILEEVYFPAVVVRLIGDSSAHRFIGDIIGNDVFDSDANEWESGDGYLSRVQLEITGWTLNADERMALRHAIKTILVGNFEVFDSQGMVELELQFSDAEDFQTHNAPMYLTNCSLSCYAPTVITSTAAPIAAVSVSVK